MFFHRPDRKSASGRIQQKVHEKSARRAILRIEQLEDRFLLAQYVWNGPVDGLWSQPANWQPNGIIQPGDTLIFNNTNNNNSKMDLTTQAGGRTFSVLRIEGYSGSIKLQNGITIDVLTMSSGTITVDTGATGGIEVRQDGDSSTLGPSTWTGGNIGGGKNLQFKLRGAPARQMTFNLGHATTTPTYSGGWWHVGTDCTVNWNQGDVIMMANPDTDAPLLQNLGSFWARSTGIMTAPVGTTWIFHNNGAVMLRGDGTFERCNLRNRGGEVYKRAALDGTPGTFVVVGTVEQEGNLQIESGTFQVSGNFSQPGGTTTVNDDQSLDVFGSIDVAGGR